MEETKRPPILNKGSARDLAPAAPVPGAQPPIETDPVRQTKRHETAAGFPAIVRTVRYVTGRMGVARGASALFEVNKLHGFACQACAWPSPDHHRHFPAFCENGAKTVSTEGTFPLMPTQFLQKYRRNDRSQ